MTTHRIGLIVPSSDVTVETEVLSSAGALPGAGQLLDGSPARPPLQSRS